MSTHCENCGCKIRSGYCTNCQEEAYIAFFQAPGMHFSEVFMDKAWQQDAESKGPRAKLITVTHNAKSYTVTKLASGHEWRLTSVDSPRDSITLNRDQMILAGFGRVLETGHDKSRTNS